MKITALKEIHFPAVSNIYTEGISTGIATFETQVPDWELWNDKFLQECRFVAIEENEIIGWCALSAASKRSVYSGVAENTVYVSEKARGKGVGKALLLHLIDASEKERFWTLQASIFPQNKASIALHQQCGFRIIGTREKIAERGGIWYDNVLLERRSKKIAYMKNVLVLCTGNSCRSQMAHGYLKQMAGDRVTVYSAGIETHGINPGAAATMKKDGIDITGHTSNHVDEYQGVEWDFIITVCDHANENCPFIPAPNAVRLHHNFYDPSKFKGNTADTEAAFAKARDEIKEYCKSFVTDHL